MTPHQVRTRSRPRTRSAESVEGFLSVAQYSLLSNGPDTAVSLSNCCYFLILIKARQYSLKIKSPQTQFIILILFFPSYKQTKYDKDITQNKFCLNILTIKMNENKLNSPSGINEVNFPFGVKVQAANLSLKL